MTRDRCDVQPIAVPPRCSSGVLNRKRASLAVSGVRVWHVCFDAIVALRRDIHAHPEPGFEAGDSRTDLALVREF